MTSVSVVIPTVGRPALARTLRSVRFQDWAFGDEVILVGDGPCPTARSLFEQYRLPGRYIEYPTRLGYWGHGARNRMMDDRTAAGGYIAALDDDDEWAPNALAIIRAALSAAPHRPHIFRMSGHPAVGTVWKDEDIRKGNVGTPMLVCPNDPAKLGRYTLAYGGDCDFIRDTCAFYTAGPEWHKEVICRVRPTD